MFFFPISDDNDTGSRPNCLLCINCNLLFYIPLAEYIALLISIKLQFIILALLPASLLGGQQGYIHPYLTIFSSMFMHGGWMHLIGNMVFLWIFGDNIEDSMGHKKFLIFYLLCGVFAALLQSGINPQSDIPMIGASGAIAGILGAYLLLHPKANVNVLLWLFIFITVIKVPAFIVLSVWIVSQFFSASFASTGGVAYFAHIGGFIAGGLLIYFFKYPHISLFQQGNSQSFESSNFSINDY